MIERIILIGGGPSIKEGIGMDLWDKLKDEFTIGMNSSMHFFNATIECFYDRDFYVDHLDTIIKLPCAIVRYDRKIHDETGWPFNVTLIPHIEFPNFYSSFKEGLGLYAPSLVGFLALSLAVLMHPKNIYLLGYDWTHGPPGYDQKKDPPCTTHWYQNQIEHHRGVGRTNFYEAVAADKRFLPYTNEPLHIYNVSMQSNITVFPKISYREFFNMISFPAAPLPEQTQDQYRAEVKRVLRTYMGNNIVERNFALIKSALSNIVGLDFKKGKEVNVPLKHPVEIDPEDDVDTILKKYQDAIDWDKMDEEEKIKKDGKG